MNKRYIKPLILVVILIAVISFVKITNVEQYLTKEHITAMVDGAGVFGVVVFGALYALATIFFLPGTPLTIISGFLFGGVAGTVTVVIGASIGAGISFLIARYFGKEFTDRLLKDRFKKLYEYDEKLEANGFITTLFLRLVPLFPFNGLNFALGLTKVKFRDYILATFLGIIPGSFILVNIGSSATNIKSPKLYLFIGLFVLLALIPGCYKKYCNIRDKKKSNI